MHRVIVLEKNKISLIDSKDNTTKWSIKDNNKMVSTYRLDNYIFLYTFNGWTKMYTSLINIETGEFYCCLLYTSPSPRDATLSRMPSSA